MRHNYALSNQTQCIILCGVVTKEFFFSTQLLYILFCHDYMESERGLILGCSHYDIFWFCHQKLQRVFFFYLYCLWQIKISNLYRFVVHTDIEILVVNNQ